jgi:hypothetical protein
MISVSLLRILFPPPWTFPAGGEKFFGFCSFRQKKEQLTKAGQPFLLELVLIFRD